MPATTHGVDKTSFDPVVRRGCFEPQRVVDAVARIIERQARSRVDAVEIVPKSPQHRRSRRHDSTRRLVMDQRRPPLQVGRLVSPDLAAPHDELSSSQENPAAASPSSSRLSVAADDARTNADRFPHSSMMSPGSELSTAASSRSACSSVNASTRSRNSPWRSSGPNRSRLRLTPSRGGFCCAVAASCRAPGVAQWAGKGDPLPKSLRIVPDPIRSPRKSEPPKTALESRKGGSCRPFAAAWQADALAN